MLVYHFLNIKFKNVVILRDVYNMCDVRTERFYCKGAAPIVEFRKFNSDKTERYKVNHFVKKDIKGYFDLEDMVIERYVLDWCRDKTCKYYREVI
jgi:hypothetical protein